MLVHQTSIQSRADTIICFVDNESYADCSIWETTKEVWADGDLKWCWVDRENRAERVVYVVDNPAWADVKVFRTKNENWVQGTFPAK